MPGYHDTTFHWVVLMPKVWAEIPSGGTHS